MDTRHQFDFQKNLPVFVRAIPPGMKHIKLRGRTYEVGDSIPWQEIGVEYDTIKRFFDLKLMHHNTEREVATKVGDGLDLMTLEELSELVESLNEKVKKNTTTEKDYHKYKVKKSRSRGQQMGLIRTWRHHYGKFEAM